MQTLLFANVYVALTYLQIKTISNSEVKIPNYLIGEPHTHYSHIARESIAHVNRNPIQCAFGRLKARWQVLTKEMDFRLENIPTIIYTCFALHNFCERSSVYINEEQEKTQMELLKPNEAQFKNLADPIFSCVEGEGEVILQH